MNIYFSATVKEKNLWLCLNIQPVLQALNGWIILKKSGYKGVDLATSAEVWATWFDQMKPQKKLETKPNEFKILK